MAGWQQVCVRPQRETRVRVAEVVRQFFDRDAPRQQARGLEVPKRERAVTHIRQLPINMHDHLLPVDVIRRQPENLTLPKTKTATDRN